MHEKPTNLIDQCKVNLISDKLYQNSYWAKIAESPAAIAADCNAGNFAYKCLDAIQNYSYENPEIYQGSFIEKDAYSRAANFINGK